MLRGLRAEIWYDSYFFTALNEYPQFSGHSILSSIIETRALVRWKGSL
jgi:hypothetical protein